MAIPEYRTIPLQLLQVVTLLTFGLAYWIVPVALVLIMVLLLPFLSPICLILSRLFGEGDPDLSPFV